MRLIQIISLFFIIFTTPNEKERKHCTVSVRIHIYIYIFVYLFYYMAEQSWLCISALAWVRCLAGQAQFEWMSNVLIKSHRGRIEEEFRYS